MLNVISQIEEIQKQDKELKEKYGISLDEAIKKYLDYVKSPDKLSGDDEKEYKKLVDLLTKNNVRDK